MATFPIVSLKNKYDDLFPTQNRNKLPVASKQNHQQQALRQGVGNRLTGGPQWVQKISQMWPDPEQMEEVFPYNHGIRRKHACVS